MSKRINKIHQLDSLRAIAAFSVIFYHYLPEYKLGTFSFGWIGVDIFFVISGYLITAILLEQKEIINNRFLIIKNFIIKRALRLFPTYYLLITFFAVMMFAFGLYVWNKGDAVFYYTYTQNILFFRDGMKGNQLNHVWTLAVEEQFYLFWPWMVIYLSNKNLMRLLFALILASFLFKSFSDIQNLRMLTIAHFDTLGGGAIIALVMKERKETVPLFLNKVKYFTLLIFTAILCIGITHHLPGYMTSFSVLALSITLLVGCYYNFEGIIGKFLNIPFLNYLGKISYGLYLYHKVIPYFIKLFLSKLHLQINSCLLFFVSITLTIAIAHLSYILLEKRFLKLKDRFDL